MPRDFETVRAAATYRITFDDLFMVQKHPVAPAHGDTDLLARRIADVLHALHPVEIRVSANDPVGAIVAYVCVPADVMPEAIDRKADALRARWRGEDRRITRTDPETGVSVSYPIHNASFTGASEEQIRKVLTDVWEEMAADAGHVSA